MLSRRNFLLALASVILVPSRAFGAEPLTVQIWTDSTGNGAHDPREWPYLWADDLAALGGSVEVIPWLVEEERYGEPARIGSGPLTMRIINFAVPGSTFEYPMGRLWGQVFGARPDAFIVSLGLNHAQGLDVGVAKGEIVTGVERLLAMHPGVPVTCVKQNPFMDTDEMDGVYSILDEVAEFYGLDLIDVGTLFGNADKAAPLYIEGDLVHPNQVGQDLYAAAITSYWKGRQARHPAQLFERAPNLLENADFSLNEAGHADGWLLGGTTSAALFDVDGMAELSASGDGYAYLYQDLSVVALQQVRGRSISVGFDVQMADGASDGQGRILVSFDGASPQTIQSRARIPLGGMNGWRAICGVTVPEDVTMVRVGIFHDQALTPSVVPLRIRKALAFIGDVGPFA